MNKGIARSRDIEHRPFTRTFRRARPLQCARAAENRLGQAAIARNGIALLAATFAAISFCAQPAHAQRQFPDGHYCKTPPGSTTYLCKALTEYVSGDLNKVFVISHRGYWGAAGTAETSLKAVQDAYDHGYTITEVDVILTRDKALVLSHDQQTNRTTDLPPTPNVAGPFAQSEDKDNNSYWRSMNFSSSTSNSVPKPDGSGVYPAYPPTSTGHYRDRFGTATSMQISTLDDVLDYMKTHDTAVMLDIKSVAKDEWIENLQRSLDKIIAIDPDGSKIGYKIIVKPGSTAEIKASEIEAKFSAVEWAYFNHKINNVLINIAQANRPHSLEKQFIDDWAKVPSLIGIEHIYKSPADPLLQPRADFGNISIVEYTKRLGLRTGAFQPIPADQNGNAGGRGNYYNPPNGLGGSTIDNLTGNLEFLFSLPTNISAGSLVTDRPDEAIDYLNIFGTYAPYSKR